MRSDAAFILRIVFIILPVYLVGMICWEMGKWIGAVLGLW